MLLNTRLVELEGSKMFYPIAKQCTKSATLTKIQIQSKSISLSESICFRKIILFKRITRKQLIVKPKSILFRMDLTYSVMPSYSIRITSALKIRRHRSMQSRILKVLHRHSGIFSKGSGCYSPPLAYFTTNLSFCFYFSMKVLHMVIMFKFAMMKNRKRAIVKK